MLEIILLSRVLSVTMKFEHDCNAHSIIKGTACKGDPPTVEVCGTCGILFDTSFPTGVALSKKESKSVERSEVF